MRRLLALGVALVLVAGVAWWAWEETHPSYCEVVAQRQAELGEVAARGGAGAAFDALEHYRELREAAPDDIRDEWRIVVERIEELEAALVEAGVEPDDYEAERDGDRLGEAERDRIQDAARALGDPTTGRAMAGLEQQALDVCGTPLER